MRKILFFLCCVAFTLLAGPRAQWLVYPEELKEGVNKERYFRTEFEARQKIRQAFVNYIIDDYGSVMLNGRLVDREASRLSEHPHAKQFDITKLVVNGRNALCVTSINGGGSGGMILHLSITYEDGSEQEVFTDTTWKTSREKMAGWEQPGFAATEWQTPVSVGDYHSDPWAPIYDMIALYANDDAAAELKRRRENELKCRQILEQLSTEPAEQARIVYKDGGAFFDIGGKLYRPVLYNYSSGGRNTPNFREKVRNFMAADIKLIVFGIEADQFWKGPGKYDYQALDKALAAAFTLAPEARFMFSITFSHGPRWWNELHPEETIKYARTDTKYSPRDNIGNYTAPSYASELWRREATETVRKFVEHTESTPYGKHVFGYRLSAGVYSEWHYYGMAGAMPDVSEPMVRLFRTYLRDQYNGDTKLLRKAWNQPDVTFENALPPPPEVRLQYLADSLRDPVKHAWSIDFLHCMQLSLRNALLSMNKAAKEACKGRALIGNYCGYFFGMGYTAEGWHLVNDEFMRSPYVDFQVSPCCYSGFFRNLGSSMLARSLVASYRLHNKLCIFEADGRTCLAQGGNKHVDTIQESIAMLSRDLVQAISKGSAYWYYDFGRDWYNAPELLQFFHNIAPVYDAVRDFSSSADVAVIGDWESAYYHAVQTSYGGAQTYLGINYLAHELKAAGLQFDAYSFADIDHPALQNYKLYIFPQLFYMTPEKLAKLSALRKAGKTLLFFATPGWLTPHGPDAASIFQTTGMRAEVLEKKAPVTTTLADGSVMDCVGSPFRVGMKYSPVLNITDPQATVLGTVRLEDGTRIPAYAKKANAAGAVTYVCNSAVMTAAELRNLARTAGVHSYCDSDRGVVFANNSMISFHTGTPGEYTLRAKTPVKWTMVYPEKRSLPGRQSKLTFRASQPDTYIFVIDTPAVSSSQNK